jgi:hypothetical protein
MDLLAVDLQALPTTLVAAPEPVAGEQERSVPARTNVSTRGTGKRFVHSDERKA